jgi:hypothetical protein
MNSLKKQNVLNIYKINMKKQILIKIRLISLIIVILINNFTFITNAQTTGKEVICERDWSTFLSSIISYDGFVEYWKDIIYRYNKNICYYMDIDRVLKKLKKAREQIRKAFYSCDSARAADLKQTYYELEAELFFLRNFVDIGTTEIKNADDKKVYEALRKKFYINKSYFTEEKVKELFEKFKNKYASRVTVTYKECKDMGLTALSKKWESLVENFKSMGATGKSIKEQWEKSLNTPIKRTGGFLKGYLDIRLGGLPPKKAVDQIYKELKSQYETSLKRYNPKKVQKSLEQNQEQEEQEESGIGPSLEELQNAIITNDENYVKKVKKANLMAKYEALYKHGADEIAKDFKEKLEELNEIIQNTYPIFENLQKCSKKTADKQCKK